MGKTIKADFQYYLDNQKKFVEEYNGKVIVIHKCEVVGVYDTELEAIEESRKTMAMGSFLVQKVAPGEESYSQTFHSRVAFN